MWKAWINWSLYFFSIQCRSKTARYLRWSRRSSINLKFFYSNYAAKIPACSLIMSLQSNSHPGNKISACKYLLDGRTTQPPHRDRVDSSMKWISSMIFLTSVAGVGILSNFSSTSFFTTQTWKECMISFWEKIIATNNEFFQLSHSKCSVLFLPWLDK